MKDQKNPITKGLPALWHRAEEWYSFADNPRAKPGYHILLTVDEQTYTPGRATMGADHPLAWWHCVEKGQPCLLFGARSRRIYVLRGANYSALQQRDILGTRRERPVVQRGEVISTL